MTDCDGMKCFLFDGCSGKTAGCRVCGPDDDGCPVYRWFKEKLIVRCKDCKHWDRTTREEGNECISGPWDDAVCEVFRDWDSYGDLGEHFRRTNGDWFCADGERR